MHSSIALFIAHVYVYLYLYLREEPSHGSKTEHPSNLALSSRLASRNTPLLRPGEMNNRRQEEAVAIVRHTSKGIVPGQESTQQSKETARLDEFLIGHTIHIEKISKGQ